MRLLRGVCVATFVFMFNALVLDSDRAFAQAAPASQAAGPRFRADGPNADEFGRKEGYPSCIAYIDERCRVGALSRYDTLFPARTIAAPKQPTRLERAAVEPVVRYSFAGLDLTLDDYLDRHPVTGLLIARGNTILAERYQYGRTDRDRLTSFSMAKSVVGLLIGIALKEGAIRSIDDLAETYGPARGSSRFGSVIGPQDGRHRCNPAAARLRRQPHDSSAGAVVAVLKTLLSDRADLQ